MKPLSPHDRPFRAPAEDGAPPPAPEEVLELWYRPPHSHDLVLDGKDVTSDHKPPFRHVYGHVRFRVLLPDRREVLVEFNPADEADKNKEGGLFVMPGRLTCRVWSHGGEEESEAHVSKAALPLTARQADLLLEVLERMFPEGPHSTRADWGRFELFSRNCTTTCAGILMEVLERGGRVLEGQQRLHYIFMTANSPATLWPRVRRWANAAPGSILRRPPPDGRLR